MQAACIAVLLLQYNINNRITRVHNWSIIGLISSADIVGKIVVAILLAASIWSWSIIINKYISYNLLIKRIKAFENTFWSGQVLDNLYEQMKRTIPDNPLAAVFLSAMHEFKRVDNKKIVISDTSLRDGLKDRITQSMNLVRNREVQELEKNLTHLATIGSSTPFIGLFGMVWGVMNSFPTGIGEQTVTLSSLAPGMTEALFVTAVGLFVAIPAVIFYNILTTKADLIAAKIEDFSLELHTLLARAIDEGKI